LIHNADISAHTEDNAIRIALKAQLHSPVRWVETVQWMAKNGCTKLVEFGPGRVLAGLAKRIDKGLEAYPVYDPDTLQAALNAVGART
jgi:[acyl-carrier-protein] S-malonyltransferase